MPILRRSYDTKLSALLLVRKNNKRVGFGFFNTVMPNNNHK